MTLLDQLKAELPKIVDTATNLQKKTGNESSCPCPECGGEDRFIVLHGEDRFFCRQCGINGDKIDYHKLIMGVDSLPELAKNMGIGQPKMETARAYKKNLIEEYPYQDESGNTLFTVDRYEEQGRKKTFRQWHNLEGKRINGIDGVRRVPYRLPDLLNSSEIFIVEGEKDVGRLVSEGLTATCFMGATWKPEYAQYFKDKSVYILPDNDQPGRELGQEIAKATGGEIVSLPGLPPKGDVSNWFDAGHTVDELRKIVIAAPTEKPKNESYNDEDDSDKKKPKASQLIIDTVTKNATLFHDADDTPYAQFDNNGHFELWSLESKQFQRWIGQALYKKFQMVPNKNSLSDSVNVLAGQAVYDGQEIDIHIRVAAVDDNYFLDLCNDDWQMIKIEPGKWQVVNGEDCGVYFRRTSTMRPLPMPENHCFEKLPALLSRHLNMTEQHLRLTIAYLIECWMPDTEYPVMEITGSPGSGKSTAQEMVRFCVDPNKVNLRAAPKTTDDIFVSAINNHLVSYNNLSRISSGQSDALCSLSTGGGHAGRKFFTNTDETATDVKKPVILNGIGHLAKMPDLIDRLLKICLQPIDSTENKKKKQVMTDFQKDLPAILGALLDLFSKVIGVLPTVKLDQLPRMADFATLCQAVTQVYKWDDSLLSAYYENRSLSFADSLESSPAIMAIVNVVNEQGSYKGTIGGLFNLIESHKKEHDSWIKTARGLGGKLRLHTPALLAVGIKVDFDPIRHNDGFHINLSIVHDTDGGQHSQHTRHTQDIHHSEPTRERRERRECITPPVSRTIKEDVEIF